MKVYQAINAVQSALSKLGIAKDSRNTMQGYNFRGIDAVYNALSPLLAQHGLCILPRMLARTCVERQSAKGSTLFYVTVEAEFDFVCAKDGSKHTVKTFGEAMDSGDKATNKAMSAAYKYAAFQSFAIPTEGDNDADATTHEVVPQKIITPALPKIEIDEETRIYLQDLAMECVGFIKEGKPREAHKKIESENLDGEQKIALWGMLDSKARSAITLAKNSPQLG